jgi:uncharacterized membrane protein
MASRRIASVDLLRGIVMVIMALDHTRDFINASAFAFPPEDLTRTTAAIFLTRWITHICAPTFMLCAGLGAGLRLQRGTSVADLSRFLWTRGLWLIVLEFTLVRLGFFFSLTTGPLILLVFWALGMSMVALALLVRLPYRWLLALSVSMMALHNLADAVTPAAFGPLAWLWQILHQQSLIDANGVPVLVAYPLVPWIGVMGAGFCLARVYELPPDRRRRVLIGLGVALTLTFLAVRSANVYGDPRPWTLQPRPWFTWLSFLNCTKYPPSLSFLLMTLGPAIVLLGLLDRADPDERNPFLVFGRVPLFYFVLHIPMIHAAEIGLAWLRYGNAPFVTLPPPSLGTLRGVFPADFGWSLAIVYVVTAGVVLAMYPLCLWFSRLKARRRTWWLSYL